MRPKYKQSHDIRVVTLFLESLVLALPHSPVPYCEFYMKSTVHLICFLDSQGVPLLHTVRLFGIGNV